MLFTKQTEHVFKDYEFALKKLYHYFVKQFHLTQLQYIKCVQLLFGPNTQIPTAPRGRPVRIFAAQSPSNTGFSLATKAR